MPTLESIVEWLRGLPPAGLYVAIFLTSYIENIFPPSPSDAILLFIATLIGIGTIGHVESILIATAGSTLGFMTAFLLGRRYGRNWVASGRFPFLTQNSLTKVDGWFDKYGYGVIVANRFLAGTRAVISFFAGMSNLAMLRTTILCTLSALVWNTILIELGAFLGKNWRDGEVILDRYGLVVSILLALAAIYFLVRWLIRRWKEAGENDVKPEA